MQSYLIHCCTVVLLFSHSKSCSSKAILFMCFLCPRKRMQEFLPRRTSSRIEKLAKEKEESARVMAKEEEERKVKETEERERRQR